MTPPGEDLPPEVREYLRQMASKGGKAGAAVTNAKLTTAQRKRAGKKAAAALTPEQRHERAKLAAAARWGAKKEKPAKKR